jgi:UMF1 family MFS transporter
MKDNFAFYKDIAKESFKELFKVGANLFANRNLKFFLSSFFFYSIGMQTIFLMATLFGTSEIFTKEEDQPKLIITILVIQIVAIFGALAFSRMSKSIGNKNVISIAVFIWIIFIIKSLLPKYKKKHTLGKVCFDIFKISALNLQLLQDRVYV